MEQDGDLRRCHTSAEHRFRLWNHPWSWVRFRLGDDLYYMVLSNSCVDRFPPHHMHRALKRYHNEVQTSEAFSTAGRTVKSGLVASAVVSSWTWAATLLQSSGVTYRYGVSGAFWYASSATVQILLFVTLAIELNRRAPNAYTFLEVIRARYSVVAHAVFLTFGLMTNILVTAMLLTGGSAVASSLSGMPIAAACFLLPAGVVLYTSKCLDDPTGIHSLHLS